MTHSIWPRFGRFVVSALAGLGITLGLLTLLSFSLSDAASARSPRGARRQSPDSAEVVLQGPVATETPDIASGNWPGPPSTRVAPQQTTVTYLMTSALFANPERGFYRLFPTHAPIMDPLTPARLQEITDTLILRLYYMRPYTQTTISDEYLQMIADDLHVLRDTGKKAIVRFAYRDNYTDTDPSLPQLMAHLNQLEPYLRENSDVIAVLQAGFLGPWGEWHDFRPPFGDPDPNWPLLRQVIARELEILPCDRMVQLRRPWFKYNIFETVTYYSQGIPYPTPLPDSLAHTCTSIARVGHHNDCFLCTLTDCGTYVYTPTEYPYLAQETKHVVMGGETGNYAACAGYDEDRLGCETAQRELEQFHWSFLSRDWFTGTHEIWREGGCLKKIERRLGYRLALLEGTFDQSVRPGRDFALRLQMVNEGYAAPLNPRDVKLVLRHTEDPQRLYAFPLPYNPQKWLPGATYTISETVPISRDMPAGRYDLFLFLPDPEQRLADRPAFAIQLANQGVWESSTGYNRLHHTLVVSPPYSLYLPLVFASFETSSPSQACVHSGGTVSTRMCCQAVGDYPNSCAVGACGCAPEYSHEVQTCDCGPERCFDGERCVKITPP